MDGSSPSKARSSLDDFIILKQLGKGAFAGVYLVQRKQDGQKYALKRVALTGMSSREVQDVLGEVRFIASIRHPNVVQYMDSFMNGSELCIVMELATGGDLAGKLKSPDSVLPEEACWRYFIQLLCGVAHLHHLKIMHRDLKPANVFLLADGTIKLGDLNVSKLTEAGRAKTQIGTPLYMPPELWQSKPYDYTADIWSAGCILYEMLAGRPPFNARDMSELSKRVQAGSYPPIPAERGYSKDLLMLVAACLQTNPAKRPTARQILSMPAVMKWKERLAPSILATLQAEQADHAGSSETLLNTIRLPRPEQGGLKAIKDALPSPQFGKQQRPSVDAGFKPGVVVPVRPLTSQPQSAAVAGAQPGFGANVGAYGAGGSAQAVASAAKASAAAPSRLSAALPAQVPASGSSGDKPGSLGGTPVRLPAAGGWTPASVSSAGASPGQVVRVGQVVVHGSGGSPLKPMMVAGPLPSGPSGSPVARAAAMPAAGRPSLQGKSDGKQAKIMAPMAGQAAILAARGSAYK